MKRTLLLALILSLTIAGSAQELTTRMLVKAGAAIPTGDFGSKRISTNSGFAKTGRSIGFNLYVPLMKGLDISTGYSYQTFSIDRVAFDENSVRTIKASGDYIITDEFRHRSGFNNYTNSNFFLGLKLDIGLNEKYKFYIRPELTYSRFKVPDISLTVTDSAFQIGSSQSTNPSGTIAFTFSTGLEYELSDQLYFAFDISFLKSEHELKTKATATDQNGNIGQLSTESNETFSEMAISVGLVFKLSTKKKE